MGCSYMSETGYASAHPANHNPIPRTAWIVQAVLRKSGSSPLGSRMTAGFRPTSENMARPTRKTVARAMVPKASGNSSLVRMRFEPSCRARWMAKPPVIQNPDCMARPPRDVEELIAFRECFNFAIICPTIRTCQTRLANSIRFQAALNSAPVEPDCAHTACSSMQRPLACLALKSLCGSKLRGSSDHNAGTNWHRLT